MCVRAMPTCPRGRAACPCPWWMGAPVRERGAGGTRMFSLLLLLPGAFLPAGRLGRGWGRGCGTWQQRSERELAARDADSLSCLLPPFCPAQEGRRLFLTWGPGTERYLRLFLMRKKWEVMQHQLRFPRSLQRDFLPPAHFPSKARHLRPCSRYQLGRGADPAWPWPQVGTAPAVAAAGWRGWALGWGCPGHRAQQSLGHTRGARRAPAAAQAGGAGGSSHPAPHPTASSAHLHIWAGSAASPHRRPVPARDCASSGLCQPANRSRCGPSARAPPEPGSPEQPHLGPLGLIPALLTLSHTR